MICCLLHTTKNTRSYWINMACPVYSYYLPMLTVLVHCHSASAPCYSFNFPTLSSNHTVHAIEGSIVNLPFKLNTTNCPTDWNEPVQIYVLMPQKEGYFRTDVCAATLLKQTKCTLISNENCLCKKVTDVDMGFVLSMAMSQGDSGSWLWRSDDGLETHIYFDIQGKAQRRQTTLKNEDKATTDVNAHTAIANTSFDGDTHQSDTASADIFETTPKPDHVEESKPMITGLIYGGVCVAVVIVVVVVVVVIFQRSRRRAKTGVCGSLPPPPTPHRMRGQATDAVRFRPYPLQTDRDSFGSVHSHVYFEIEDGTHQYMNTTRQATTSSSLDSDSFLTDSRCVRPKASASSHSSGSESYAIAYGCTVIGTPTAENQNEKVAPCTDSDGYLSPIPSISGTSNTHHTIGTLVLSVQSMAALPRVTPNKGTQQTMMAGDLYLHPVASSFEPTTPTTASEKIEDKRDDPLGAMFKRPVATVKTMHSGELGSAACVSCKKN